MSQNHSTGVTCRLTRAPLTLYGHASSKFLTKGANEWMGCFNIVSRYFTKTATSSGIFNSTRNHSSRMCTAHSSLYRGGSASGGCLWQRPPWTKTPQKEHGINDRDPPEGTWDRAARQEVTSYIDPIWTDRDTCENITLPQTSFAGGNYCDFWATIPQTIVAIMTVIAPIHDCLSA